MKSFEKPLSAEEEKEILERLYNGDNKARDILVEKNMRLVAHMTKKYSTPDRDVRDLISVGTVGLIKAINSFKPDKGIRFATYSAYITPAYPQFFRKLTLCFFIISKQSISF